MDQPNYGLLQQSMPQMQPVNQSNALLTGMQQGQALSLNNRKMNVEEQQAQSQRTLINAQAKELAQKMSLQDLTTASNIVGAVALNPNPATYQQALMTAQRYGIDVSDAPRTWGAEAQAYVNNASIMSKQALEWKQAQAQLAMTQAHLNNASADVNIKALQSGLNTPFPNAPGGSSYNPNSQPSNLLSPDGQPAQPQQIAQNTNAVNQSQVTPSLSGPAKMEMEKAQAKDIVDYQKELATDNKTAGDLLSNIDAFKYNYKQTSQTGPRMGSVVGQDSWLIDSNAQEADKAANRLALALVPTLHTRLTQQELMFLSHSTLNRKLGEEAVNQISDQLAAGAKRGQQQEIFAQSLINKGVTSRGVIDSLWQKFVSENPVIDTSNGHVITKNIDNWKDYTTPEAFTALKSGDAIHKNTINQTPIGGIQDTPEIRSQIKTQYPNATDAQISQMIQLQNMKSQQQQTAEKKTLNNGNSPVIGDTVKKYESGNTGAATISSGKGDPGGVSYGTYQLSSKTGTVNTFLKQTGYDKQFQGLTPGTDAFNTRWKQLADNDPQFANAQHAFIQDAMFKPVATVAQQAGLPMTPRVSEALWSMSIQHGKADMLVKRAAAMTQNPNDENEVLKNLYNVRRQYVMNLPNLSSQTKKSLLNRYANEEQDVMNMQA